ncbi:GAF domain-containing sensor histidine kinase [Fibrivirga algicola]|uniref:histidine kinase n=1 Tax=Fibrivirga algicola TaxID=2950420 RepID=A0ABX0QKK9_9BACT|nr:ATP-binding protein [Fibrivirga algicola]ARK12851.1 hypothetical protein A6C57_22350 [Fibrella sp. ES10-3-2-2]NID12829.1 PAS domain-containing protein [Fibrivirga algicola]
MNLPLASYNEAARLAALHSYNILDTLPEQDYEDITQLAAQICQTPIALITLVDDRRQWFKANKGFSLSETAREDSFCAHNLVRPAGPLIIEDARIDERFQTNPLVVGDPRIVFYAGQPLVDDHGLVLGSLCVLDSQRRQLDEGQINALRILAKQVITLLTMRRKAAQETQLRGQLQASEARFRSLIEKAPVAISLFVGRELTIEVANERMIQLWGKGKAVLGKRLIDALPELKGQPFPTLLEQVYSSGTPYEGRSVPATLLIDNELKTRYYDFNYQPVRDINGAVYAVMDIAIDVTREVLLRQQYDQARQSLQQAVDLSQLGVWNIDLSTQTASFSPRIADWVGEESLTLQRCIAAIDPLDLPRFEAAFLRAQHPESGGQLEVEYRLVNARTAQVFLLHSMGQTSFDEQGNPVAIYGVSRDITQVRATQLELEEQVHQRTLELLRANQDLQRSNDNLQRFAYVASHDLQEPLRKIQSFGDLLKNQYQSELGDGVDLLERMQGAAARMSTLIRDLLTFSRIATQPSIAGQVPLTDVIDQVLIDLEMRIQESEAQISCAPLPVVAGDATQLGQLFQNLLSNALKFQKSGERPLIRIHSQHVLASGLPASIHPARSVRSYYRIDVRDNGIGFEQKYVDRIFQVFQRLHGKGQYVGTGIGLAICEKVATNHGGAMSASSEPGQGATFSVYLPAH